MQRALYVAVMMLGSLSAGCGGPGGGACEAACGEKAECAAVGSNLTVLPAVEDGRQVATSSLSGTPRWAGGIQGLRIKRDGTPSQDPVSEIAGTKLYASGWVYKFCSGSEEIVFGAGPLTSTMEKGCGTINCDTLPMFQLPTVDSPALIAAAFPSDPPDTLYGMMLVLVGSTDRVWQITKLPGGATVKVNADTGAVVP